MFSITTSSFPEKQGHWFRKILWQKKWILPQKWQNMYNF